jgi:hypothetical protein
MAVYGRPKRYLIMEAILVFGVRVPKGAVPPFDESACVIPEGGTADDIVDLNPPLAIMSFLGEEIDGCKLVQYGDSDNPSYILTVFDHRAIFVAVSGATEATPARAKYLPDTIAKWSTCLRGFWTRYDLPGLGWDTPDWWLVAAPGVR